MSDANSHIPRPWLTPEVIRRVVGQATFERARAYATPERVTYLESAQRVVAEVWGSDDDPYDLVVTYDDDARSFAGHCSCPMFFNCKHVAAVVLMVSRTQAAAPSATTQWERRFAPLVARRASTRAPVQVAVMFSLTSPKENTRLSIRPVIRNDKGAWVKGRVSWQTFAYPRSYSLEVDPAVHQLLHEIVLMYRASPSVNYYGTAPTDLRLSDIASSRLWSCLADLVQRGVALVDASRQHHSVELFTAPTRATLDVRDDGKSLLVRPIVMTPETRSPATFMFLGQPAHGIAVWNPERADTGPLDLRVGPLESPLSSDAQQLFEDPGDVTVPPVDRARFVREVWPVLSRSVPVSTYDGTFVVPVTTVSLHLHCSSPAPDAVALHWSWRYQTGEDAQELPLWSLELDVAHGEAHHEGRDHAREQHLMVALHALENSLQEVHLGGPSRRLVPAQMLTGMAAVRFVEHDLPVLRTLEGLEVTEDAIPVYAEFTLAPRVSVAGTTSLDWFDLEISVDVGEEAVPLRALFVALARGETHLLLPSGTYFSLERPEFVHLRNLIDEAHVDSATESGSLRVNRYQISWWNDLENIAVLSEEATQWSRAMRALSHVTEVAQLALPGSVHAELRPYQQRGFEWMSFLREHSLGGVLADDMGLGKTLQTIAMIARARELDPSAAPFLVVAPTSVVHNWISECRRFAPTLSSVMVEATSAREDAPSLASLWRGADVVVTSYALFRLDFAAYQELTWSGLILDEAQFLKNHQSKGYACARQLSTPFKLALTGTPLENNLMELWSLLSIVSPGLLPDARHFTSYYRTPIEKHADASRLAQLQRRIRPLMLRRTKRDVAVDLPAKIEQILELELNPRHRRLYDTQLQRERKKVLGLLDNVQKNRFKIFASLTLLRQLSIDPALVDDAHARVPSTKLEALMEQIDDIVAGGHRVLVFSQFTRFLRRVRERLDAEGVAYCYLDGATRRRAQVIEEFTQGRAPVFLISLKAGGVGLNLTAADYCIVLDPWWNPATEAQAIDRTHRIGQTRSVVVIRFVATDTIEEKVMAMKERKAALFASVLEGTSSATASITADDIRSLLE